MQSFTTDTSHQSNLIKQLHGVKIDTNHIPDLHVTRMASQPHLISGVLHKMAHGALWRILPEAAKGLDEQCIVSIY